MTVHASKGLEFDAVFIGGLEQGLFPHHNSSSDRDGLEEERRLMYVAITRAARRLYLSHSQTRMLHGQTRYNVKSRFFDELPEACLKWITPKQQGFGSYAPNSRSLQRLSDQALGAILGFKSEPCQPPLPRKKRALAAGRPGQVRAVFHTKFGEGKVLAIEGNGRRCPRPGQLPPPRHQVAGAECGEIDGGGLISPAGATAKWPLLRCVRRWAGQGGLCCGPVNIWTPAGPMSTSNFSFLTSHSPLLAELGATAERLYPYDPASCVLKLRLLAESLTQEVAERVGLSVGQSTQAELLRAVDQRLGLDPQVRQILHALRQRGNEGGAPGQPPHWLPRGA